jgi:phosphoribosylformylglycinamidine cyclo-ligase
MSRYMELGVNIKKTGIDRFKKSITNLFPGAFCVIQRDPDDAETGLVLHTDSAGSKPIQAYLHYKETGDPGWFRGLAQDALAMNLDDVLCVGAAPIAFVDYVAFNTLLIDRVDLLGALSEGFDNCISIMKEQGLRFMFAGGETADLPDLLRTLDVCVTMFGRAKLINFITGERIQPGDLIVGVRSGGTINYEERTNSGIMSNGLTLARSCLMNADYLKKYPEMSHPSKGRYTGSYRFDEELDELGMTVGEALLSPTRIFAPVVQSVLEELRDGVHGMVHNTGGGQTKCLRVGQNIEYIKDDLPNIDPIFKLIKKESDVSWEEMYQDFNMGIGYEFIIDPLIADDVLDICEKYGVGVSVIGHCEENSKGNSLKIVSKYGEFHYS